MRMIVEMKERKKENTVLTDQIRMVLSSEADAMYSELPVHDIQETPPPCPESRWTMDADFASQTLTVPSAAAQRRKRKSESEKKR